MMSDKTPANAGHNLARSTDFLPRALRQWTSSEPRQGWKGSINSVGPVHLIAEFTAGEFAPAGGIFFRNPRVRVTDEAADRERKEFDTLMLIIIGHAELGTDCGQQYFS